MDTADRILKDILATICPPAQSVEIRIHPALRNLGACYRKAEKDEAARIPTYLVAAIANALSLLPAPLPREQKADWERDQNGRYDMSPRGGRLEPGS